MDRPTFAQAFRAARHAAGLSQAALAQKAGLTAPYISLIEARRRRPPSPPLIERLAKARGVKPDAQLDQAAQERTPGAIRKRLEGLDRERGRVHQARDRILSTTLFNLAQRPEVLADLDLAGAEGLWFKGVLGRLGGKMRGVRSAHEARARSEELLDPLPSAERDRLMEALPDVVSDGPSEGGPSPARGETPTGGSATGQGPVGVRLEVHAALVPRASATEALVVDARWAATGAFLWRLAGDEAHPRFEAGDLLLVEPGRTAEEGDLVALRHEGRDILRLFRRQGGEVRLEALRPELAPLRLSAAAFAPVGVVTHVLRSMA